MRQQWIRAQLTPYRLALLAVAAAALAQYVINRGVGPVLPFGVFYTASMVSAWYGGLGPGLLTTALSMVIADRLFMPNVALSPIFNFPSFRLALLGASGLVMSVLSESLHRARTEAAHAAETLAVKHAELEREVSARQQADEVRARLNAELQAADRRKDEFLAMLAHELRNPLAPIRNAVHALERIGPRDPQVDLLREMIERQVTHLARLVDDLLDVSRITRGKVTLHRERVALADVIEQAVDTARPFLERQGHQLTVSLATPPIELIGDPARLAQIFANLLTNAAKFTPLRGRVTLTAERGADDVVVRVRDTGIGIAPELLRHVFDMFVQHSVPIDRQEGGLGIGLTLVKMLTEMHGGTVTAASAGPGRGSEFVVSLPILPARLSLPDSAPPVEATGPVAPLQILVVEDNVDAAESFALILQLNGHHVRIAHDGLSALQVATEFAADVAFLDIGLPNMDGYELARSLRAMPSHQSSVLVALTGYAQDQDKERAQQAGFDHHLTKPVDPQRVQALLAQLDPARRAGDPALRQLH